jgi:hypothetical protein
LTEQLGGRNGGLFGQVHLAGAARAAAHRTRGVDDEHQGRAGRHRLAAQVHSDGQHLFERRSGVAAWTIGALATGDDQTASIVLHVGLQGAHLARGKLVGWNVGQDHGGVVAQRSHVQRGRDGAGNLDLEARAP